MSTQDFNPDLIEKLMQEGHISQENSDGLRQHASKLAAQLTDRGIDLAEELTPSVIQTESSGRADAVSPKGATGLMQVMPATAAEVAAKLGMESYDLKNPEDNKKIGQAYLRQMLDKYGGNKELALAAYNAGPGRVDRELKATGGTTFADIDQNLPTETQNYVAKIVPQQAPTPEPQTVTEEAPIPTQQPVPEGPAIGALAGQPGAVGPGIGAQIGQIPTPEQLQAENQALAAQTSQQSLVNADQASKLGDAQATLDNLAASQQAQDIASSHSDVDTAFAMQGVGKAYGYNAEAQGNAATADVYGQLGKQIEAQSVDASAKRDLALSKTADDLDRYRQKVIEFGKASVDPNHLFKSQSTFASIMLGLGAATQAAAGNTAQGLKLVDDAINRDIAIQKANIDLKQNDVANEHNLMAANNVYLKNLDDAETAARAQMLAKATAMVQQIAANTNSEVAKGNAIAIQGELQAKQMALESKLEKDRQGRNAQQVMADSLAAVTGGSDQNLSPSQKAVQSLAMAKEEFRPLVLTSLDGKPLGIAKTKEDKEAFQVALEARKVVKDEIANIRQLYAEHGTPILDTVTHAKLQKSIGTLRQKVIQAQDRGLRGFSKEMVENLESLLPRNLFPESTIGAAYQSAKRTFAFPSYVPTVLDIFEGYYDKQFLNDMKDSVLMSTPELKKTFALESAKAGQVPGVVKK